MTHVPPGDPPPAVELTSIRRTFDGGVRVFDGLSLSVPAGQFVALLGPSGCGKSTLLRIIAGLERVDHGTVRVFGDDPAKRPTAAHSEDPAHSGGGAHFGGGGEAHSGGGVAFVFQDAHLLPWRSAWRNVALPLELMGRPSRPRRDAAMAALEAVGLADAAERYPAELSGGMRMRVSLARALVMQPRLLLLDEPFAALDEMVRLRLDEHLHQLWAAAANLTVLFVTHAISEATFLAQRVVVLSQRPAKIVADRLSDLPARRDASVRELPAFAHEQRLHLDALERGAAYGVADHRLPRRA